MATGPNTLRQLQDAFLAQYQWRYRLKIQPLTQPTNTTTTLGLDPQGFCEITIHGSQQQKGKEPHYQSYAHIEQGIMVIIRAYRNEDRDTQKKEPQEDPPHFSEMLFQQWVQVAVLKERTELPPLRQVYLYHVVEQKLLNGVINPFRMKEMETQQFAPNTSNFISISQTPFGKAIGFCLKDHFAQMSIQSIEVRAGKAAITGLAPPYNVLFSLGKKPGQ